MDSNNVRTNPRTKNFLNRGVSFEETLKPVDNNQKEEGGSPTTSNNINNPDSAFRKRTESKGLEVPSIDKRGKILVSDNSIDSPMVSNSYVLTASDDDDNTDVNSIGRRESNTKWSSNQNSSVKERAATINTINTNNYEDEEELVFKNFTDDAFDRYILLLDYKKYICSIYFTIQLCQ